MSLLPAWPSRTGRRLLVGLVALLVATGTTVADAVTAPKANANKSEAATPDRLRYDVTLRGNADGSHWTGRQRVTFRNASERPLHEVYVRLWGNGDDKCGTPGKPPPSG